MGKKILLLSLAVVFIFTLSGCATTRQNKDLEMQGLRNQISVLESQVRSKDEEINSLKDAASKAPEEIVTAKNKKCAGETKERPSIKQIQVALTNAGYYQGIMDGKMGRKTREAIKAFQKANNLPVDGKAGKKTWAALKDYLEKKVK